MCVRRVGIALLNFVNIVFDIDIDICERRGESENITTHTMGQLPENIPTPFTARKNKIIEELAIPDEDYTDLSPKGSVDIGVRDLIRDINALPGLVTTSSCAGRISVFLEGRRDGGSVARQLESQQDGEQDDQRVFAPSGGKGAGRWLYVSHDPFPENCSTSLHEAFGLVPGDGKPPAPKADRALRLVRFHYDPLVCIYLSFLFFLPLFFLLLLPMLASLSFIYIRLIDSSLTQP